MSSDWIALLYVLIGLLAVIGPTLDGVSTKDEKKALARKLNARFLGTQDSATAIPVFKVVFDTLDGVVLRVFGPRITSFRFVFSTMNLDAKGDMEIRVTGPDWEGVRHVFHVRCVPAESEKEFISASQKIASVLSEDGFRDVPVVLALTAGKTLFSIDGGPTVIEAKVDTLLGYSGD